MGIQNILHALCACLLPRFCACCGLISDLVDIDLCRPCRSILPWLDLACYYCGLAISTASESIACEKCQDSPPVYYRLCALFYYRQPLSRLINQLKFAQKIYIAAMLGTLLAESIVTRYKTQELPQVIIPVPLHKKRLRQRGYNQALELCWPLAKRLQIPIASNLCLRTSNTTPQSKLTKDQRLRNLRSAFRVCKKIPYKHVALVDDVVTTGSTIRAITQVLLDAGVERVDVWCISRA